MELDESWRVTVRLSCGHEKTVQVPPDFDLEERIATTLCPFCKEERMIVGPAESPEHRD